MNIYIDESGGFVPRPGQNRVCCIAAIVVPTARASELEAAFVALRQTWTHAPEIKGSAMSDDQLAATLRLLAAHQAIVHICAMDTGHHSLERVARFQAAQGQKITASLGPQHGREARQSVEELRAEWERLSPQLVCQVFALISLVEEVLRQSTVFLVQRQPAELGQFNWFVDPKDIKPTRYEHVWRHLVLAFLQTRSLEEPFTTLKDYDYSAFDRFWIPTPEHMKGVMPTSEGGTHLGLLMNESIAFPQSEDSPGLQLADAVASTFTRGVNGRLRPEVWRLLGPLLLQRPNRDNVRQPAVRLIALGSGPDPWLSDYQSYVVKAMSLRAQEMFSE